MQQSEIDNLVSEALKKASSKYINKQFNESEELYRQILRVDIDNQEAMEMLSLTLSQNFKHDEAKQIGEKALSRDPSNYKVYNNLALINGTAGDHDEAVRLFKIAIKLNPSEAFLYTNLAIEIKKQGNEELALSMMADTAKRYSNSHHVWFNYGALAQEFGMYSLAKELYEKALYISPEMSVCHYNLSAVHFLLREYTEGWAEYEWRWKQFENLWKIRARIGLPYWSGESLAGKTILLYGEQGVGDTIMFARFVKDVKNLGAKTILLIVPTLYDLFRSCSGVDELVTVFHTYADYQCSLMSIPGILGMEYSDISCPHRYLSPTGLGDGDWDDYQGLKIGICWAGNPQHPNDRNRSIPLHHFESLSGFNLFSLQKDRRPHVYPDIGVVDYCANTNLQFVDMSEYMTDFNKTAKILDRLDVVVTADTALAHLSGALGKRTYVMLPKGPDWRWGLNDSTTNWYDDMTLCRQTTKGDWGGVFSELKV